ncbi:MAG: GNAT family N-acetyltransferase [Caldilineaceae bacterium]
MPVSLVYQLFSTRDEFAKLQPEWNELLQRSAANTIFLTWEWISNWWDCFGADRQPWVWAVREAGTGKLLGVTPLTRQQYITRKGLRFHELAFIGCTLTAPDHLDFIIDIKYEQALAPLLLQKLMVQRGQWGVLRLNGLAAGSPLCALLRNKSGYRSSAEEVCPYITLPADWETFALALSKKMRSNLEYVGRLLERQYPGNVTYQEVTSQQALERSLPTLFRLSRAVRQTHGEAGAFDDNRMREFHQRVASQFLNNGWLRLHQLRVGDEVIAMLYCFHYNNVLSYYQSGYDPEWYKYSPGSQVIAYAIQRAIQEGASEFDFLRGAEPYKFKWTEQVRHDLNLEVTTGVVKKLHNLYLNVAGFARTAHLQLLRRRPA